MLKTMTVCRMPLEFPKEIDPVFIGGNHEFLFAFIAGSLSPTPLEPYFIRSMRTAEKYAITQNEFHIKAKIELESLTTETNSRG
jgi:hypothetical protein